MRRAALVLAILALPAAAAASPRLTAGASMGFAQSKADAADDPNGTLGLFGRVAFTNRLSAQLELQRIQTEDYSGVDIRTGTALLVVDLRGSGTLIPILVAGIGFDRVSDNDYYSETGTHTEGGLGLEYRARAGFTLGADFRLGGRSMPDQVYYDDLPPDVTFFAPSHLSDGEYRSFRVTLGVRF